MKVVDIYLPLSSVNIDHYIHLHFGEYLLFIIIIIIRDIFWNYTTAQAFAENF